MIQQGPYHTSLRWFLLMAGFLAIVWCQGGLMVWQVLRVVHRQARAGASLRNDTVRVSANDQVSWLDAQELTINGRMFDVSRRVNTGTGLMLIGAFDDRDDDLMSRLKHFFQPEKLPAKRKAVFWFFDGLPATRLSHTVACHTAPALQYVVPPLLALPLIAPKTATPPPRDC